jgi:hypothetical protein
MSRVFFYGLFMDAGLLREMKLSPVELGQAVLHEYRLHIGNKATLIASPGAKSYGMLIELDDDELSDLYSGPGVIDYRPETVETERVDDGTIQPALCYNLPADQLGSEFNSEYARNLSSLLTRLGFPLTYARKVNQPNV